jgi:hypothetical protein
MSDHDPRPSTFKVTPQVPPPTQGSSSGFAFMVGALLIAVLAIGYFAIGMPGLQRHEAQAPARQIDVTVQQPANQAPATLPAMAPPAPARPTAPRQ